MLCCNELPFAICLKEKKENNKERKEILGGELLSVKAMCKNND
jgi:hypothetical protein